MNRIVRLILLVLGMMGSGIALPAQCLDNSFEFLDGNQARVRFNNGANYFWDMRSKTAYELPKGSGLSPAFAGGLWLGGLDPGGNLHVAATTYRLGVWDWYAGPYRDGVAHDCDASVMADTAVFDKGLKRLSNGKVLILTPKDVLIYDPVTRQTIVRPLPATRSWLDAVELQDGRIFLFGDDLYPTKNPVLFMDTITYTITGGPTLHWFHKESSVNVLNDGRVLMAGVIGCEVFDPVTNLSSTVPDMLYPRMKHGSVKLPNGDIFVAGGGSSLNGTGLTLMTQRFDDTLGYWFPGPTLSVGRQRASLTLLPSGQVLVSGGATISNSTQFYDPAAGTLSPGPVLPDSSVAMTVMVLDTHELVMATRGISSNYGRIYRFDLQTASFRDIYIQRSGLSALLLGPEELLIDVNAGNELQRVNIVTAQQDDDRWQRIWKMDRSQIQDFQSDFLAGTVDFSQYPQIESWPAHGDEGQGEDRNLAPFVDVNGDGYYRPATDGDYPCIVGDQALWWVFNDQGSHVETQGMPLGVQVEAMAYAFDCSQTPCPDTSMDYSIFIHFEVTNHSDSAYHELYLGQMQDFDLGFFFDDMVGCDSSLGLAFGYNGRDNDQQYGANPPAWGSVVLPNGFVDTMSAAIYYENDFTVRGNPVVPADYYGYMRGFWKDSLPVVNNGIDGYPGTAPGTRSNFMFPSTEGFCGGSLAGWSEINLGNAYGDRRFLQASGPFVLAPGERTQWDLGFIYARDSTRLASVCALKDATATIRSWWDSQLDKSCWNTVVAREEPRPMATSLRVVPNPVSGSGFAVEFGAELMADGQVQLLDLQGRVLQQVNVSLGATRQVMDVTNLPAGVYFVRLTDGQLPRTARVVIW